MADIQGTGTSDSNCHSGRRRTLALFLAALAVAAPAARALAQAGPKAFSPEELDQMLAPIALYPDALLSQVLMAASYPLEIVEAARWSQANPNSQGRCRGQRRRRQELGCQREVAGRLPVRAEAAQRASRLDPEAGRRDDRPAGRRRRLDPAAARQGGRGRHPEEPARSRPSRPRRRAAKPSTPSSRPIRRSSTCRPTTRTRPMGSGPTRAYPPTYYPPPAAPC